MDEMLELAQRLDFAAECSDMGRKPDHSSVTRRSAKALREAAATIEALRAELAGRDAEIAAWLRGNPIAEDADACLRAPVGNVWADYFATAIASGQYREGEAK